MGSKWHRGGLGWASGLEVNNNHRRQDAPPPAKRLPNTNDIRESLLNNSPWVDRANTVDPGKCGAPTQPGKKPLSPGIRPSGIFRRRCMPVAIC